MNAAQFDHLIEHTEKFAWKYPNLYRLQVALFAALGYCYLLLVLAFLLSPAILAFGLVVLHQPFNIWAWFYPLCIGFPGVTFAMGMLPALLGNYSPLYGEILNRSQFPELFAMLDELTAKLKAPQLQNVLLTTKFNASVVQAPRFGIFGSYDNYLTLGLPLMTVLSCEELRAVLAHELGHLSGNHSRFAGLIYRLRQTLTDTVQYMQRVNEGHPSIFIAPFFK